MSDDAALLAAARSLTQTAGLVPPVGLTQLTGGKNNRVFRLGLTDGTSVILKSYHNDPRDTRDRLGAEWAFLEYVWSRGVHSVPQPLACDRAAHVALYALVPGRRLARQELRRAHIQAAVNFAVAINGAPREVSQLRPASEACFSLTEHLATVDRRVSRCDAIEPLAPVAADAQRFVRQTLQPAWVTVRQKIFEGARRSGIDPAAQIGSHEICISPSDFGFHNALVDDGGNTTFIDFEYAGRDDPAKLVCDFFCQPEIPIPVESHVEFRDDVLNGLGASEATRVRSRLLLDAYRVKWACIMLNEFLPVGAARRAFADQKNVADREFAQLRKAEATVAAIGS